MVERKGEDVPDVPKISKALLIIKRTEYFDDFRHHTFGKINTPLSYVIHKSDTVPGVAPPMVIGKSYSGNNGSVEKKLITRASHTNTHFN